jgi:nucleotide-binding universal stress UspA family protein
MPNLVQNPTILVPVDFDEPSLRAVSAAVDLARVFGGRVVVLHVVPPTSFPEGTRVLPVSDEDQVDLEEYVSTRARHLLDEFFAKTMIAGVEARQEARAGHPVESILRAIDECEATLVVVGTHGRTGAARLALGSVAEHVLRRSPVPVLVVGNPAKAKETKTAKHPKQKQPKAPLDPRAHDAAFAGAAVVTGVVTGAATAGAFAGPVGAAFGGAIGGVVGAIAGGAMAREQAREAEIDRDLDETIGVTSGSLGTPPETKELSPETLRELAEADRHRLN